MKRSEFLHLTGITGLATVVSGCEALQSLDASAAAEGTGVQFAGLITVLAKYRATPQQRQVAETRASTAYVNKALKPAYEERRRELQTVARTEVRRVEREAASKPAPERQQAIAQVREQTEQQLIGLDAAWYRESSALMGRSTAPAGVAMPTAGTVAFASMQTESSQLLADASSYVPQNIAVSVPATGVLAEADAADSVMFWNTRQRQLAKDEVYVVDRVPPIGRVASFDDIQAAYAGAGGL